MYTPTALFTDLNSGGVDGLSSLSLLVESLLVNPEAQKKKQAPGAERIRFADLRPSLPSRNRTETHPTSRYKLLPIESYYVSGG